jgi:hypothetical protein
MTGIGVQFAGGGLLNDASGIHDYDSVGITGDDAEVMGDED